MSITVSKWGNSLGIRIPSAIVDALSINNGDKIEYEVKKEAVIIRKKKSTADIFEEFYKKKFANISFADMEAAEEIDFGEDVGNEVF